MGAGRRFITLSPQTLAIPRIGKSAKGAKAGTADSSCAPRTVGWPKVQYDGFANHSSVSAVSPS